jgi:hypothetical protein
MKLIWNALCVLAIANLLAIGGFVFWLRSTDRLNTDRAREVRQLFTETLAQRKAREDEEAARQVQAAREDQEKAKFQKPPLTASEQLVARIEKTEMDRQREELLRRQVDDLKDVLGRQQAAIDKAREELTAERTAFEAMRKKIRDFEGSAQFKKTMAVLEGLKPDKAYAMLKEIIAQRPVPVAESGPVAGGAAAVTPATQTPGIPGATSGMDQAVSYLSAMQDRLRTKVFDQIVQDNPRLAADLLERLRTRGTEIAALPENPKK